jgi:hypothetical protein
MRSAARRSGLFDELDYDQTTLAPSGDVWRSTTDSRGHERRRRQFGVNRLDAIVGRCNLDAAGIIRAVLEAVDQLPRQPPPLATRPCSSPRSGEIAARESTNGIADQINGQ